MSEKSMLDTDIYIVICEEYVGGLFACEAKVAADSRDDALLTLLDSVAPVAVIALNAKEGWSRDVSEDFAGAWWEAIMDEIDLDSPVVPDFIEKHLGAAEIEDRVNRLRQNAKDEEAHIRSVSRPQ